MKNFDKKDLLLFIPIGILLFIQIPNLSLPYFWDEAWSYFTSIKKMAESSPSLLPGAVPLDYCKGHPQFYFFISSLWMKIFPDSIVMMRFFALSISAGLLAVVYFGLKRIVNWQAGFFASLLISVQSLFLAQSIFILPEILVTLLFTLTFFYFFENKYIPYAITGSIMVLTKETTIIFCITFGVFYLLSLFCRSNRERFKLNELISLFFPGIVYVIFLYLHYHKFGIIFYGEHLNYISFNMSAISDNLYHAFSSIFLNYGRMAITILLALSLPYYLYLNKKRMRLIALGLFSIVTFLTFSIFNFYTIRYGIVLIVLTILIFSYMIALLKLNAYIKYFVVSILSVICLFYSLTKKGNCDSDLGYVETIKVHQEIVRFCEENNMYDEPLSVSFNMIFNLRDKQIGYVKGEKVFTNVQDWKNIKTARYFIYESTFNENDESVIYAKNNFKLIKSFSKKHAWGYIYENPEFESQGEHTAIQ